MKAGQQTDFFHKNTAVNFYSVIDWKSHNIFCKFYVTLEAIDEVKEKLRVTVEQTYIQ